MRAGAYLRPGSIFANLRGGSLSIIIALALVLALSGIAYVTLIRKAKRPIEERWHKPTPDECGWIPIRPPNVGPKPGGSLPVVCKKCAFVIDQFGHCKCQAAGIVGSDEMERVAAAKLKNKKYRSIDDDWSV